MGRSYQFQKETIQRSINRKLILWITFLRSQMTAMLYLKATYNTLVNKSLQ